MRKYLSRGDVNILLFSLLGVAISIFQGYVISNMSFSRSVVVACGILQFAAAICGAFSGYVLFKAHPWVRWEQLRIAIVVGCALISGWGIYYSYTWFDMWLEMRSLGLR